MPPPELSPPKLEHGGFHPTHWSIVLAAHGTSAAEAEVALAELCRNYWRPLSLVVRRSVPNPHDAEDLVQAFFQHLLATQEIAEADPARGRFRSFLLARLQHFLVDDWRKGQRAKRGGGTAPVSFDDPAVTERLRERFAHDDDPAKLFDRAWAATLLERAISRLAAECDAGGHSSRFATVKGFLTGDRGETPLAAAARSLGLTLPALKSVVHRLRQRYREIVREEVAMTLAQGEDVESELRWLVSALRGA